MPEISRLLIANRGEIAVRIARSAHACGIATVAVFSDPDRLAPHVGASDLAVQLPGAAPADTYLRGDVIVGAALRTGCDAVHPGYGFLSENADFARAVEQAGLVFVGPRPETIEAMASKIRAKALMAEAGVPTLASIAVEADTRGEDLVEPATALGFPVLVKASAGGGGRGMRIVRQASDLPESIESARNEATSAFGDGTLFIERFVTSPRHIEIQIIGDEHGSVAHLFERECSIQRRFQKIVEESPAPGLDPALRARLCEAAVAAGHALGYRGAGTVEFVLDASGDFFFLEVNTRLQVEHPITEAITGVDLVREQLNVARGRPLSAEVLDARPNGHAIEVRVYAEDPSNGYLPASGILREFTFPDSLRVDTGYESGSAVTTHYDAMLAKVIAHAETRAEAAALLARGLEAAHVHGVVTNRRLLLGILREPDFLAGQLSTAYLDTHPAHQLEVPEVDDLTGALLAATAACRLLRQEGRSVQGTIAPRFRNVPANRALVTLRSATGTSEVEFDAASGFDRFWVDGDEVPALVQAVETPGRPSCRVEIVRETVLSSWLVSVDSSDHVDVDGPFGSTELVVVDPLPIPVPAVEKGSLEAPMPGAVIRILVDEGDQVSEGQPILVLEAMKMEHSVRAPASGRVSALHVAVGDQVDLGVALAVVEET